MENTDIWCLPVDALQRSSPTIDHCSRRRPAPDVLYVDDTLTSAGSVAGLDLGLHVIRRDFGAETANHVARRLVVPPHRHGGQAQFIDVNVRVDQADSLSDLLAWATANLTLQITVDDLAARAHMAPRTLARRFRDDVGTTPHRWLTQQRVALAQRLLETSTAGIDQIATETGFRTAVTLRHHFQHTLGTTPTAYRHHFRRAA